MDDAIYVGTVPAGTTIKEIGGRLVFVHPDEPPYFFCASIDTATGKIVFEKTVIETGQS